MKVRIQRPLPSCATSNEADELEKANRNLASWFKSMKMIMPFMLLVCLSRSGNMELATDWRKRDYAAPFERANVFCRMAPVIQLVSFEPGKRITPLSITEPLNGLRDLVKASCRIWLPVMRFGPVKEVEFHVSFGFRF